MQRNLPNLRIGTRGSALALAQAHETRDRLVAAHGLTADDIEIVVIKTTGDRIRDRPLGDIGGKGLFTKEIEEALLEGSIDLAVHSMKDMPTLLPDGLGIHALLPREDVRDALIGPVARLADIPEGALVGTASLRRQAQLLRVRPDVEITLIRGNVQTRIEKVRRGEMYVTFLANAGMKRLGLEHEVAGIIETEDMLPAVAQGAIGIECRTADTVTRDLLNALNHTETEQRLAAERAFLAALDGSCRTPLAGLATVADGLISFKGEIITPDGRISHETRRSGPISDAAQMGRDAGEELKAKGGPGFFEGH